MTADSSADQAEAAAAFQLVHNRVEAYYTAKVTAFGATPLGADWSCVATQQMRFVQLLKLCDFASPFSLNDLGCGYGALLDVLDRRHSDCAIDYLGIDLSAAMLRHARHTYRGNPRAHFVRGDRGTRVADYSVASGIFNVCLDHQRTSWEAYIETTLAQLASTSQRGFAVNFAAPRPPAAATPAGLYTTGPDRWADFCRERLAADIEVIGGYGMAEFTLLARLPRERVGR